MDRKTTFLMISGVALIAVLFIIIAVQHHSGVTVASHDEAVEQAAAHEGEAVAEADEAAHEEEAAKAEEASGEDEEAVAEEESEAEAEGDAAEEPEAAEEKEKAEEPKAAAAEGGAEFPEVIKMENAAYEHKKPIVVFTHLKHVEEYKAVCGDCHHDDEAQPLADLKIGDEVLGCIECHDQPGEKPKGKGAPKLSKSEELAYHAEALHENCKSCHKEYNKKNKTKAAPATCGQCHAK